MKKRHISKRKFHLSRRLNGYFNLQTIKYLVKYRPHYALFLPFFITKEYLKLLKNRKNAQKVNQELELKYKLKTASLHGKQIKDLVRVLALYLPQFHRIKENDEWWCPGFTEWTNVKASKPLFAGHNQPRVPHKDIGYYDLADANVMRKQAAMAQKYGVGGFCFYYYWFKNGHRLLEKPINNYLEAKDIDFPFCFCWANENWTRTWDGSAQNVIMPQDHGKENLLNMFSDMLNAFADKRYIKIDGKPLLLIYRAELIDDIKEIAAAWRQMAVQAELPGAYLVSVQNFKITNPKIYGFDAALEFAPAYGVEHLNKPKNIDVDLLGENVTVHSYPQTVQFMMNRKTPNYKRFRSVFCDWDNSPRKKNNGAYLFLDTNLQDFKKHLYHAAKYTIANFDNDERLLFINAWNEWGEGTYLEPDEKNGYAYLESVKEIMDKKIA